MGLLEKAGKIQTEEPSSPAETESPETVVLPDPEPVQEKPTKKAKIRKERVKKAKKDGFFIKDQSGYDEYYVIKGDGLKDTFIDDLNVNPDMTAHRMAQNFMKKNNSFKTNRIILSRFIDLITENTTV
mgnify:CR=1 FL=1